MNKDIKKILVALALYSLAGGFFYNFWELWLADNNMSINTISTILSLCSLMAVSIIFLSSNLINPKRIKSFLFILMVVKTIILTSLFFLYQSNLNAVIKFLILIDYGIDTEIFACFYPLIAIIKKDDKLYAARGLVYDISFYFGVLIVSLLLGKTIGNFMFGYNVYVIMAAILMFISTLVLFSIKMDDYFKKSKAKERNDILIKLIGKIKKDKISLLFLTFVFFASMAYYILLALLLSVMINEFGMTPFWASNNKLTISILGVLISTLILAKLTFKNNYINISIKFLGRSLFCIIAWIFPCKITFGIALFYTLILGSAYTHVVDAPYINRFSNEDQLAFSNLKEIVGYLSRSIGTFLCGTCIVLGLRYNFILASVASFIAVLFAYQALYHYNNEKKRGKNGRK